MEQGDRSTAVMAHVGAVFLPVVAPALLAIMHRKNLFVRSHAMTPSSRSDVPLGAARRPAAMVERRSAGNTDQPFALADGLREPALTSGASQPSSEIVA